jgi:hypothetical protein
VLLLSVSFPAVAGTVTCDDQVNEARASLADRLDRTSRDKLNEASSLCRENRRAEALKIVQQVRDAFKASESPTRKGH